MLVTERWARSWSRYTGSKPAGDFSHPRRKVIGGRLPLLSARPAVNTPAEERHRPSTKLYYLVWEAQRLGVNNLSKVVTQLCPGGNWFHDLLITSSTSYRYTNAVHCGSQKRASLFSARTLLFLDDFCNFWASLATPYFKKWFHELKVCTV